MINSRKEYAKIRSEINQIYETQYKTKELQLIHHSELTEKHMCTGLKTMVLMSITFSMWFEIFIKEAGYGRVHDQT